LGQHSIRVIGQIRDGTRLSEDESLIYYVYRSKYNKETLHYLKEGMSLNEFLVHLDFISQQEDLEYAVHKDQTQNK